MLVLTRKSEEEILIGEDITIKIKKIEGCRVSIAISAPPEIKILRKELKGADTDHRQS